MFTLSIRFQSYYNASSSFGVVRIKINLLSVMVLQRKMDGLYFLNEGLYFFLIERSYHKWQ